TGFNNQERTQLMHSVTYTNFKKKECKALFLFIYQSLDAMNFEKILNILSIKEYYKGDGKIKKGEVVDLPMTI
ncbi:hypothetical protein CR513_08819, partial [Mucuna pruriens]